MTLKLTKSQRWLVMKAIADLTSEEGMERFLAEFPECNLEEMAADLEDLVQKLQELNK